MSLAVPYAHGRQRRSIAMMNEDGTEQYEQEQQAAAAVLGNPAPLDAKYHEEQKEDAEDAEKPPNPWEAVEQFMTAKGELEVIIDVIRNLEERSNLTHQFVPRAALSGGTTSSAGQAALLAALTAETVRNIGRKQTALKDAASRLRRGAAALRVVVEREDAFYRELSSLQGHWKVRPHPQGGADAPFAVDLSMLTPLTRSGGPAGAGGGGAGSSSGSSKATGPGGGAAAPGPAGGSTAVASTAAGLPPLPASFIPIIKDPSGRLRVQLEEEETMAQRQQRAGGGGSSSSSSMPPSVYSQRPPPLLLLGAPDVHRFLRSQFRCLMWAHLRRLLHHEGSSPSNAASSTFLHSLCHLLVEKLAGSCRHDDVSKGVTAAAEEEEEEEQQGQGNDDYDDDAGLAHLRPLLLQHLIRHHMCDGSLLPPPRGTSSSAASGPPGLLPSVNAWLTHLSVREEVRRSLDVQLQQGAAASGARVRWLPISQPNSAACVITLQPPPPPLLSAAAAAGPQSSSHEVVLRISGTTVRLEGGAAASEPGGSVVAAAVRAGASGCRPVFLRWCRDAAQAAGGLTPVEVSTLLTDLMGADRMITD